MPANPGYSIGTWSGTCAERPSTCAVSLRGQCNGSRFTADVEQYYIPESLAPALARVPQNASVILKLDVEGRAHVQRVLVEEQSIEEYAAQVLQSTPQATN